MHHPLYVLQSARVQEACPPPLFVSRIWGGYQCHHHLSFATCVQGGCAWAASTSRSNLAFEETAGTAPALLSHLTFGVCWRSHHLQFASYTRGGCLSATSTFHSPFAFEEGASTPSLTSPARSRRPSAPLTSHLHLVFEEGVLVPPPSTSHVAFTPVPPLRLVHVLWGGISIWTL